MELVWVWYHPLPPALPVNLNATPKYFSPPPVESPWILFSTDFPEGSHSSTKHLLPLQQPLLLMDEAQWSCAVLGRLFTAVVTTTAPRSGAASLSPAGRSVPGIPAARPPKLLPVLMDPLVCHWKGQRPHLSLSPMPTSGGWPPCCPSDPESPWGDTGCCHSPHLSPASTGHPACRVSPSPSPFLRRFHQNKAAFCSAE